MTGQPPVVVVSLRLGFAKPQHQKEGSLLVQGISQTFHPASSSFLLSLRHRQPFFRVNLSVGAFSASRVPIAWSLELGAKKFHEQRTTGPLLFESAPAPPSAGFIVTFEDWALDTAAGAPLIFARLTAVTTELL